MSSCHLARGSFTPADESCLKLSAVCLKLPLNKKTRSLLPSDRQLQISGYLLHVDKKKYPLRFNSIIGILVWVLCMYFKAPLCCYWSLYPHCTWCCEYLLLYHSSTPRMSLVFLQLSQTLIFMYFIQCVSWRVAAIHTVCCCLQRTITDHITSVFTSSVLEKLWSWHHLNTRAGDLESDILSPSLYSKDKRTHRDTCV